ncbi:hypothetical protein NDU88_007094 [Pleurodeles waltl]|uniref:Uncharacterized protein n=1 Tax=Pleurodeles waltl TaxID=8319 RepID=A0AAV7VSK2_PLEWA|nr:hypothetical protein NDU88_007094 [Pleurodeles waltl]
MLLRQNVDKLRNQVKDLGTRAHGVAELLSSHISQLRDHEWHMQQQETKPADLKDRSRRNNERILGLPEGTEMTPVELFAESWLPTVLPGLNVEGELHDMHDETGIATILDEAQLLAADDDMRNLLNVQIDKSDIRWAIKHMNTGNTPGNDGLTAKFLRNM